MNPWQAKAIARRMADRSRARAGKDAPSSSELASRLREMYAEQNGSVTVSLHAEGSDYDTLRVSGGDTGSRSQEPKEGTNMAGLTVSNVGTADKPASAAGRPNLTIEAAATLKPLIQKAYNEKVAVTFEVPKEQEKLVLRALPEAGKGLNIHDDQGHFVTGDVTVRKSYFPETITIREPVLDEETGAHLMDEDTEEYLYEEHQVPGVKFRVWTDKKIQRDS